MSATQTPGGYDAPSSLLTPNQSPISDLQLPHPLHKPHQLLPCAKLFGSFPDLLNQSADNALLSRGEIFFLNFIIDCNQPDMIPVEQIVDQTIASPLAFALGR